MNWKQRTGRIASLGNLLTGAGLLLLLTSGGTYAYNLYGELQAQADPWLAQVQAASAQREVTPTPNPLPRSSAGASSQTQPIAPARQPPPVAATPTPRSYPEAVGLSIPSLKLQSRIVSVGIEDGEYVVPKFYVGHLEGSPNPGRQGNGVYLGHVQSISSGNVFARLPGIKVGAEITLYTSEQTWSYAVVETAIVRYDDLSVLAPTADDQITLITCTGEWDARLHQYTARFVAVARLVRSQQTSAVNLAPVPS